MSPQFHVIVLQVKDGPPRMLTPYEALLYARAQHYRTRYRAIIGVVGMQVVLTTFMAVLGIPANSIIISILGGALAVAGASCLVSHVAGKDLAE